MRNTAHRMWGQMVRGWNDYLYVPLTMLVYLSIIEGGLLILFPQLKSYTAGFFGIFSYALTILVSWLLGRRAINLDREQKE